jgi:hypothetical protein
LIYWSQGNIQDFLLAIRAKKCPYNIFDFKKFKELVLNFILLNNPFFGQFQVYLIRIYLIILKSK